MGRDWVAFRGKHDLAAVNVHPIVAGGNLARKTPVHAVLFEKGGVGSDRAEVVDRDDLDLLAATFTCGPQN